MAVSVNGGALQFDAVINAQQFNSAISSIEKQLSGLTTTAEKEANAIDSLIKKTATAIASYAAFAGGSNFVGDIVRVRGEFQQLEIAFRTMLGSKEKADALMMDITQFAATTPFELKDVAGATKQLLAFGISSEDIIGTLRSLGDVSAGIGAPLGDIAYLFGTIKTQGVALTQDVRQFAQRGIPVYEELAKVLGVTTEQVGDFISAGKVGFPEIEQVFKNLTAEGSKFGGLMDAQSKSLTGQISNLRDAWDEMLNTIGKGQEGLFSDIIQGAITVVKNFDTVIDILKVLVITYGSYKAAIIATAAVQSIATAATKGYTIAETLRYRAMLLSEKAMKLLNRAMLTNPFVAVTAAVAALVAALVIFNRSTSEAKSKSELLADSQKKISDQLAETKAKIEPYLEALKNANLSEEDRVRIYNKLLEIDPKIVQGLTAKTLKYEDLKKNVDLYVASLRKQYQAEANKEALQESFKTEEDLVKKLELLKKKAKDIQSKGNVVTDIVGNLIPFGKDRTRQLGQVASQIKATEEALKAQQETSKSLGATQLDNEKELQGSKQRTVKVIDEEIKALRDQQTTVSTSAGQYQDYQKKINSLEEEKKRITGAGKAEIKAAQVEENKALGMLEKRKSLLEQISDLQRGADRSGLLKEQSELDKINEKYDQVIQNVTDYNKKVDEFNKKNPKNQVQKVGQTDIVALNAARTKELSNTSLKQDAENFKKNLEEQKTIFAKYEEAKKEVGLQKARDLYGEQTKYQESFLQVLQAEAARIAPKLVAGIANVGEVEKFKTVVDAINEYNKQKNEEQIEDEKRKFIELLQASASYAQQKAAVNQKYDDLEATARKNFTGKELADRINTLRDSRETELNDLDSNIARQTDLYKKLNQDIIGFTRDRLKQEIKLLQDKLKNDATITPETRAAIQSTIDRYKSLLDETNETAKDFTKIANSLGTVAGIFGDLSSALEGVNDGLSDTLGTISEIAAVGSSAASAVASFAVGDIVGGITSTIKAITGIFSIGKKARESERKAQEEIESFNQRILAGELQITQEIRTRQREQAKLNKLKLEGLAAEKAVLEAQRQATAQQYSSLLAQLQQQSFVVGETTKKYGGFLGIGRKTKVVEITQSLAGQSFADLEKLFATGQLTGRAKELFELLQKVKQEGADIDTLLAENAQAANEIFTGTTTDSIVDAIADGFANGKRSIADFAGNFEDLMRQAMINSLKYQYLEAPLQEFYQQFAAASQSDNTLTAGEIEQLRTLYDSIIGNAQAQFDQLQQISGLNLTTGSSTSNSLTGAIKGITEQQAELLAGQFGGLRITALEHLAVGRRQLENLNQIQINTSLTVVRMSALIDKFSAYETGSRKIHVQI
jgi:Tape measure protein